MCDLPVSVARSRLDEIVDDVCAEHEPVFLTRRGCRLAAVIDADDVERLAQVAEHLADIDAANAARAEISVHGAVPRGDSQGGPRDRGGERCKVRLRASFAEIPSGSRRAVDRAERGQP